MRGLAWAGVGLLVLVAVLSLDPALVGLSETTPVLQAIAMRGWLCAGGVGLGVVLLLVALLVRRTQGRGRRLLVLGAVAVLVGLGHGAVLLERGTALPATLGPQPDGAIDVLTLNTLGAAGGVDPIIAMIDDLAPDVVALQETPADDAERVVEGVAGTYQLFTHTTGPSPVAATALLVSVDLGEYVQAPAPATTFGGVWARPVDGEGPELLSVHPVPPVVQNVATWRQELTLLTGLCERLPGIILAGDLNATVDHAAIRDAACVDGSVGVGGIGTWPAGRHPLLGAPIDHVLHDPGSWRASAARVLDAPGSGDHRAVLVRLVPVG